MNTAASDDVADAGVDAVRLARTRLSKDSNINERKSVCVCDMICWRRHKNVLVFQSHKIPFARGARARSTHREKETDVKEKASTLT